MGETRGEALLLSFAVFFQQLLVKTDFYSILMVFDPKLHIYWFKK